MYRGNALAFLPATRDLGRLREAVQGCQGCDLYRDAAQAVFGEGKRTARLVLVGEQPGDREDLSGHPFVGPAGHLLDEALAAAGIDRSLTYVTNAVKHFKWTLRGKRRLHQKPRQDEIEACGPWLAAEIEAVRPEVLVCLGATAAQALLGRSFRVTQRRGELIRDTGLAPIVMATVHPSSVLRARDAEERRQGRELLIENLRQVAPFLGHGLGKGAG
ncbi:MAG: uracil-DNA glycosylase [Dehalococcoidia bacterium]|nr:MAG: uracil-DNA glycosylase [Dehalococcoidia bacterium]